jgi:hypothetical protein
VKKPRLIILISRGDIKGDTGLIGHTLYVLKVAGYDVNATQK